MLSNNLRILLFTCFYILTLKSGYVKWIPIWFIEPVYVGLLGLGLLYFLTPRIIPVSKIIQSILLTVVLVLLWIVFSCIYTSSPDIYKHKFEKTILVFLLFFIPFLFIREKKDLRFFIPIYNSCALIGALLVIWAFITNKMDMFIIIEKSDESTVPNYLFLSIFLCSALILNLPNNKLPAILFKVLLFTSMIVLGARSPILFGSLIMIVYYSVKYITSVKKMVLFYALAALAGTVFFSWKGSERLFDRFESIGSVKGNRSFDNRVYYQQKSIDMIFQRPLLGTGFGSFAKEMKGKDIIDSPHNLFLEMGFETGIVGMLLMILFFVFTFRFMIRIISQTHDLQLKDLILRFGLIIVYFFLTAFVSLYLSNSKDIFGLIGCFLALGNAIIYEEKCQNKQQLESGDELVVMT